MLCRSPYPLTDFCTASEHLRRTRGTNFLKSFPRYVFVNAAYHDFVDSNPRKKSSRQNQELRKPDLVLALNCGFVFYKEWDASLPSMVTFANVPLIFTEYYQEDCKLDLQKLGLYFLLPGVQCLCDAKNVHCTFLASHKLKCNISY